MVYRVERIRGQSTDTLLSRIKLTVLLLALSGVAGANTPLNPFIMAPPELSALDRAAFLTRQNPAVPASAALNLALLYDEEALAEGVSPDLAFAQMCLETSYLRFGNQVRAGQWNFAGLGAVDGSGTALSFSSPREGVRAQIQHLKYYSSTLALSSESVNPRLGYVLRGSAPTAWQLSRTWASDANYGKKLLGVLQRMLDLAQTSAR